MSFKAMLLGANDVLIDVVALERDEELTDRHVDLRPHGGDCDRPPNEYRWDRARATLVPLAPHQKPRLTGVSMEAAFYADAKLREHAGAQLPADTRAWLAWYEKTVDAAKVKG